MTSTNRSVPCHHHFRDFLTIMRCAVLCVCLIAWLICLHVGQARADQKRDCSNSDYIPIFQVPLTVLEDEYHRKFGPPPEWRPNEVFVSEVSEIIQGRHNQVKCGKLTPNPNQSSPANSNGVPPLPWVVAVQGSKHFCAGVLISPDFVLSPALCVGVDTKVILGSTNPRHIAPTAEVRHSVTNYFNKELKNTKHSNDIGLVKLNQPVVFTEAIYPICLPASRTWLYLHQCYFANWGHYDPERMELSDELYVMEAELMEPYECSFRYSLEDERISESQVCLSYKHNWSSASSNRRCSVDTGGPLVCEVKGRWFVIALTSQVYSGCRNTLMPDILTKVSFFENWLVEKMMNKE